MPIDLLVVALVGGAAFLLALRHDGRRSVEPDGPRPVAADSAVEAEQKRLADLQRSGQRPRQEPPSATADLGEAPRVDDGGA